MEFLTNLYGYTTNIRDKLLKTSDNQKIVEFFDCFENMSNQNQLKNDLIPSIILFLSNCLKPPYLETEYIFNLLPILFYI